MVKAQSTLIYSENGVMKISSLGAILEDPGLGGGIGSVSG